MTGDLLVIVPSRGRPQGVITGRDSAEADCRWKSVVLLLAG